MSTLHDTDYFVVQRSGSAYHVSSSDMSTLHDTDLLVVQRDGAQYKIEAEYRQLGGAVYYFRAGNRAFGRRAGAW